MKTQFFNLCILTLVLSQPGQASTHLNLDNIKSIECSSPMKVVFSTTSGGAEKYMRRSGSIPYSYQISGFYNVGYTGQMKAVRGTPNSIVLGDFTDYPQGPDVVHELELVPTNKASIYKGYLTGVVEKSGQNYPLIRHPINCRVHLF